MMMKTTASGFNLDVMRPSGDGARGDIEVNRAAFTCAGAGDLFDTYARLKAVGIGPDRGRL